MTFGHQRGSHLMAAKVCVPVWRSEVTLLSSLVALYRVAMPDLDLSYFMCVSPA